MDRLAQCAMVETDCANRCIGGFYIERSHHTSDDCEECLEETGCIATWNDCAGDALPTLEPGCLRSLDGINAACGEAAAGAAVPAQCSAECAAVYLPWWGRCSGSAELGGVPSLAPQLVGFAATCGGAERSGH